MRVTNYIWLAQGNLPAHKRISKRLIEIRVNSQVRPPKKVQVLEPVQSDLDSREKLIRIDFNHEFSKDPYALFVIGTGDGGIEYALVTDFFATQLDELPLHTEDEHEAPRIFVYEDGADITAVYSRFSEAFETSLAEPATSRKGLIQKLIERVEQMEIG